MEKSTFNWPPHILLIDDNPSTTVLVLRLFRYLGYGVMHADKAEEIVTFIQKEQFDLIAINLAFSCLEKYWLHRTQYFRENISIIYYTPNILINDFTHAAKQAGRDIRDDSWMLYSEFFHFLPFT
ncbi:response regulator [Legionella bozemanae]|uniref:response regulator n=1 Tax=Legionella bozemanae TaxID=447 RepID=UPI0007D0A1C5|nr:response regulator [Legionella bozemanae]